MNKLQVCVMHRYGPGESCGAKGSVLLLHYLQQLVIDSGADSTVEPINCLLYCQKGPNVRWLEKGKVWHQVDEHRCDEIVQCLKSSS